MEELQHEYCEFEDVLIIPTSVWENLKGVFEDSQIVSLMDAFVRYTQSGGRTTPFPIPITKLAYSYGILEMYYAWNRIGELINELKDLEKGENPF